MNIAIDIEVDEGEDYVIIENEIKDESSKTTDNEEILVKDTVDKTGISKGCMGHS